MHADTTSRLLYPYARAPEKVVAKGAAERKMAIRSLRNLESASLIQDRQWSCKSGLGSKKPPLLPEYVLSSNVNGKDEGPAPKCSYPTSCLR